VLLRLEERLRGRVGERFRQENASYRIGHRKEKAWLSEASPETLRGPVRTKKALVRRSASAHAENQATASEGRKDKPGLLPPGLIQPS
jgi:hypothetical protein